ncbi:hypothetical protein [Neorhizobium petrolearium]|uniref:hypothetical protein n=1 Tax=Neorhizobium petrolearium TaxID=515361 RepID=UPI003F158FFC
MMHEDLQPVRLRDLADIIADAFSIGEAARETLYQQCRNWTQTGVLAPIQRPDAGRTSAGLFTAVDVCRAALLTVLRDFIGSDSKELRRLDNAMRAEQVRQFAAGGRQSYSLDAVINSILGDLEGGASEDWILGLAFLYLPEDGGREIGCAFARPHEIQDPTDPKTKEKYEFAGGLICAGFLKIPVSELLRPILIRLRKEA